MFLSFGGASWEPDFSLAWISVLKGKGSKLGTTESKGDILGLPPTPPPPTSSTQNKQKKTPNSQLLPGVGKNWSMCPKFWLFKGLSERPIPFSHIWNPTGTWYTPKIRDYWEPAVLLIDIRGSKRLHVSERSYQFCQIENLHIEVQRRHIHRKSSRGSY